MNDEIDLSGTWLAEPLEVRQQRCRELEGVMRAAYQVIGEDDFLQWMGDREPRLEMRTPVRMVMEGRALEVLDLLLSKPED